MEASNHILNGFKDGLGLYVLNLNFVEDFKTQILKFEIRKNKKDIIFIDYCRFIVRERNPFRERK